MTTNMMEALARSVANWQKLPEKEQARYLGLMAQANQAMAADLPAFNDLDKAAAAYYIARLMATFSDMHLRHVSDCILDTGIGYVMAAADALGMVRQGDSGSDDEDKPAVP